MFLSHLVLFPLHLTLMVPMVQNKKEELLWVALFCFSVQICERFLSGRGIPKCQNKLCLGYKYQPVHLANPSSDQENHLGCSIVKGTSGYELESIF